MRKSLSLCMIVKNEEAVLGRVLSLAKRFADEIIVVDTGSTDKTKQIAGQFTDKVFDFVWEDDFSAARNFSFSLASCDYIIWLDADDVIGDESIEKINFLMQDLDCDVVMCLYELVFDELGRPTYSYFRERILKREKGFLWTGAVHEVIVPSGKIVRSDIAIEHRKNHAGSGERNLKIYQKRLEESKPFSTRDLFYFGRELYYNKHFEQGIQAFTQFLERSDGYLPNIIDAHLFIKRSFDSINQPQNGINQLVKLLAITTPTAEVSCELAEWFLSKNQVEASIYWYKTALKFVPDPASGAFVNKDYYGLFPCLGLCYCYFKKGDKHTAKSYNDMAGEINSKDKRYIYNQEYFKKAGI